MTANQWPQELKSLYERATSIYRSGNRDPSAYFNPEETAALASIGLKPINVYDYVEDFVHSGVPSWDTFLLVAAARRDYFIHEQHGHTCNTELRAEELPAKKDTLGGIEWLPRIIRKAQCFLEGGLCHDIMYGCGGDRKFLKDHNIHSADLLRIVWAARGDETKVLNYIKEASPLLRHKAS